MRRVTSETEDAVPSPVFVTNSGKVTLPLQTFISFLQTDVFQSHSTSPIQHHPWSILNILCPNERALHTVFHLNSVPMAYDTIQEAEAGRS